MIQNAAEGTGRHEEGRPGERRAPGCHCRSERMVVVIGNARDRTIQAAKRWVLGLPHVGRRVWFSSAAGGTASMNSPYVPDPAGADWTRFQRAPGHNGNTRQLAATFQDFCFFEEILVMAHGSQVGLWRDLLRALETLIAGRAVRKLTLWVCESSHDIYPGNPNNQRYYEKLCGLVVPRLCPCGCDLALCVRKALDPSGRHPAGYRCPAADECARLYLAAWYEHPRSGGASWILPSDLGIDLSATSGGQPLTSPDGRMREVSVCPGPGAGGAGPYVASVRVVRGPDVFAGFQVRADTGLYETSPLNQDRIRPDRRLRDAEPRLPSSPTAYGGPRACPARDGCLVD